MGWMLHTCLHSPFYPLFPFRVKTFCSHWVHFNDISSFTDFQWNSGHRPHRLKRANVKIAHLFAALPSDVPKALVNVLPEFDRLCEVSAPGRTEEERDQCGREKKRPRDGAESRHGLLLLCLSICLRCANDYWPRERRVSEWERRWTISLLWQPLPRVLSTALFVQFWQQLWPAKECYYRALYQNH